jgi:hypothetical protein
MRLSVAETGSHDDKQTAVVFCQVLSFMQHDVLHPMLTALCANCGVRLLSPFVPALLLVEFVCRFFLHAADERVFACSCCCMASACECWL